MSRVAVVAAEIVRRVSSGELAGPRLPSFSALAQLCRCGARLIPEVVRRLAEEGVIEYAPGASGERARLPWLIIRFREADQSVSESKPVRRALLHEEIAEDLDGRISSGEWGLVMPPSRELAAEYYSTQGTLRRSLRLLAERGLVELRWLGAKPSWVVLAPGSDEYRSAIELARERVRPWVLAGVRGDALPTVTAIAAEHGVSVYGVNTVLRELAAEGVLVRARGRGGGRWVRVREGVDYRPLEERIAEVCGRRVCSGAWASGTLVVLSEVAVEFGTCPNMARKAFLLLEKQGLAVQNVPPGMGRSRTRWTVHHPDEAAGGGVLRPVPGAIADDLARLPGGDLLPSHRLLERRYGATGGIVQAALEELESRGAIVAGASSGTGVVRWRRAGDA